MFLGIENLLNPKKETASLPVIPPPEERKTFKIDSSNDSKLILFRDRNSH
jgi:hypothetical protein